MGGWPSTTLTLIPFTPTSHLLKNLVVFLPIYPSHRLNGALAPPLNEHLDPYAVLSTNDHLNTVVQGLDVSDATDL